jgi:hypothetical protein
LFGEATHKSLHGGIERGWCWGFGKCVDVNPPSTPLTQALGHQQTDPGPTGLRESSRQGHGVSGLAKKRDPFAFAGVRDLIWQQADDFATAQSTQERSHAAQIRRGRA